MDESRKIKVYLDTSVISYLDQQDAPEQMKETREVWERIKAGHYEVFISDVVLRELADCKEEAKRDLLIGHLAGGIGRDTREGYRAAPDNIVMTGFGDDVITVGELLDTLSGEGHIRFHHAVVQPEGNVYAFDLPDMIL